MFKGCSATGRMYHNFDKVSHRCVCGRWERGFKPKVECVKPRAECQICERIQATTGSLLVNHGYKRPGWGYLVGSCPGTNHAAYPATDALVKYLGGLRSYLSSCQANLDNLPNVTVLTYSRRTGKYSHATARYERETVEITRGTEGTRGIVNGQWVETPSFEDVEAQEKRRIESEIKYASEEIVRIEKRIAAAAAAA